MSGVYKGFVQYFNPITKQVTATIPQLFGSKPVTCDPFLAKETDRSLVAPMATGDRITIIWDGDQGNAIPEWIPSLEVGMHWNSAWGMRWYTGDNSSPFVDAAVGGPTTVLSGIQFKFEAGRRYRVKFSVRAADSIGAATWSGRFLLWDTVTNSGLGLDRWAGGPDINWSNVNVEWIINGDDVTRALQVRVDNVATAIRLYVIGLTIEDIGPLSPVIVTQPQPLDDTPWLNMTFINGYVNYPSDPRPVQYRRHNGNTELRGVAAPGSSVGPRAGQAIFNLPVGFRTPYVNQSLIVNTDAVVTILNVAQNGDVSANLNWTAYCFFDGAFWSLTP